MNIKPVFGLIVLLLIIYFPLFACLDLAPLRKWDESRIAINAFEMSHNGKWLVTYFYGQPDMWSTKPPIMVWAILLFYKIFGYNELAVRLPSAISATAICLFIYWFFANKFKKPWLGIICSTILVVSEIFVNMHCSRTGDYDTLLTLFMFLYAAFFFLYIEEERRKYLLLTLLFFILVSLTKGIQAWMLLPALFFYTIYRKKFLWLLRQKWFYVSMFALMVFVPGFYLLREHYNHGYIHAVMENEVGGRYNTTLEGHLQDYWFYYNAIMAILFKDWYLFLLPGAAIGISSKHKLLSHLSVFFVMVICSYFFILSSGATKLWHYVMPLAPFLSVIAGIFIYTIFDFLYTSDIIKERLRFNCMPFVFIFLIFIAPYRHILNVTLFGDQAQYWTDYTEDMSQFLMYVLHEKRNIDNCVVPDCTDFNPETQNLLWYADVIQAKNKTIKFTNDLNFANTQKIVAYKQETKDYIQNHYKTHIVQTYASVMVYNIDGPQ